MKNRLLALTNVLLPISSLDTRFNVQNCSFSAIMAIKTGCTIRSQTVTPFLSPTNQDEHMPFDRRLCHLTFCG